MARSRWKKEHKGNTLRSGFEVKVAKNLEKAKVPYEYEIEKLSYTIPESVHTYRPDFKLPGMWIEAKGRWTAQDRRKMALVIEAHPDKDIRLIFMVDNPISKNSKTRYSTWCDKRGIKYHVSREGEVPPSWLAQAKPPKKRRSPRALKD